MSVGTLTMEEYKTFVKEKDLATLRLTNVDEKGTALEEGVDLFCKSPALHRFFQKLGGGGPEEKVKMWGVNLFPLPFALELHDVTVNSPGSPLFLDGYMTNLTFLRATTLNEGIKIRFPGVYKTSELTNIFQQLKRGIQEVYLNYLHPFDLEVRICTKEVTII
jgi:hypothetical protein